jgi:hypothetical protein
MIPLVIFIGIASVRIPSVTDHREKEAQRTLSEYVNTLTGAGFVLQRIEEPRPSEEYCQAHPGQRGWRDHAALFLHVLAEKPA